MNHIELYKRLSNRYDASVELMKREAEDIDPKLKKERYRNAMIVLAAYGSVRGPFFRQSEASEINPLGRLDLLADKMYLRDDLIEAFADYPEAFARYKEIFDKADDESRRTLAIYTSVMLQTIRELDAQMKLTPVTGDEKNERALRCFALAELHNSFKNVWRRYADSTLLPFEINPRDDYLRFYFGLREPVYRIYCECEAVCDSIKDKKAQLTEFRAAKIRGQGAIMNLNAALFNTFRFGGLRECGQYYMFDHYVNIMEKQGIFKRFDEEFQRLDLNGRKKIALFTIALTVVRDLREEKMKQYDGALAANSEKEIWETGIYIDAYNELEGDFIAYGRETGVGGFLYE